MLFLLHGENQVASRLHLDRFKKGSHQILEGKTLNLSLLTSSLQPSLLESEKTIIIENPSLDLLSSVSNAPGVNLIAWFGKKLEKISLPTPPWRVSEFTAYESKILYTFLDNFLAKRLPLVLLNLKALEKEGAPFELVLGALNRQVVSLIDFKDKKASLHPYQAKKFTSFSPLWNTPELFTLLKRMLDLDYDVKSGRLREDLGLFKLILKNLA